MNINSLRAMQQGGAGFDVIAAADGEQSNTKYWSAIKAIGDDADLKAESTIAESLSTTGAYSGSALTLGQGDVVYGSFSKITVSSGTVIAYRI